MDSNLVSGNTYRISTDHTNEKANATKVNTNFLMSGGSQ